MEPDMVLRGHTGIVHRVFTIRAGDGRVLLVSQDTRWSTRVWDALTGELVAGPAGRGELAAELAPLRLDPAELAGATGSTVIPATEQAAALVVRRGHRRIRVVEPGADRTVFALRNPRDFSGAIREVFGVRFGDGTSGFAIVRHGGGAQLWTPGSVLRPWRWYPLAREVDQSAVVSDEPGGTRLGFSDHQGIDIWDAATRKVVARVDVGGRVNALTAVPVTGGPLLAVAPGHGPATGVRLCDSRGGELFGALFNRPDYGAILTLACVPGPGGTVRVASGAQDGLVRVSAPVGEAGAGAFR